MVPSKGFTEDVFAQLVNDESEFFNRKIKEEEDHAKQEESIILDRANEARSADEARLKAMQSEKDLRAKPLAKVQNDYDKTQKELQLALTSCGSKSSAASSSSSRLPAHSTVPPLPLSSNAARGV